MTRPWGAAALGRFGSSQLPRALPRSQPRAQSKSSARVLSKGWGEAPESHVALTAAQAQRVKRLAAS